VLAKVLARGPGAFASVEIVQGEALA